jgi:hypothetical protein
MTDDDIDRRLREHGAAWRDANSGRPGVDWDAVTRPSRRRIWLATGAVALAAAAIIVPLAVTAGNQTPAAPLPVAHHSSSPAPSPSPTTFPMTSNAPSGLFAIRSGTLYYDSLDSGRDLEGTRPAKAAILSAGSSPDGLVAYTALEVAGCRTEIDETYVRFASHGAGDSKLALAVATRSHGKYPCNGPEQLVVVNLHSNAVRRWNGHAQISFVGSLEWSPDGRHLAYMAAPCCGGGSDGSRVMDTAAPGTSYITQPVVLPQYTSSDRPYGPVFWWHGNLMTVLGGALRVLDGHGGVGQVEGRGLPTGEIDSVSSDPTSDHLLVTDDRDTYRWDNGHLSRVDGTWIQPSW